MNQRRPPAVVDVASLNVGDRLYMGGGQSEGVYRLPDFPGLLLKWYTTEAAAEANASWLDALVGQPAHIADPDDRTLASESTAWPVSRVVSDRRTVGVVMPEAPTDLKVARHARGAHTSSVRCERLEIDLLAKSDTYLTERGIPAQTAANRVKICHTLARLGRLFERCGIVYADWSYSNAFWHPANQRVFLIDIDPCSYGPRKHVQTSGFEDPLTPLGVAVDGYADRYRAALLIARCMTGQRDMNTVLAALRAMSDPVPATLVRMLAARNRTERPSFEELARAFEVVDASGVITWRPKPPRREATVTVPVIAPTYPTTTARARLAQPYQPTYPPSQPYQPSRPAKPSFSSTPTPEPSAGATAVTWVVLICVAVVVLVVLCAIF